MDSAEYVYSRVVLTKTVKDGDDAELYQPVNGKTSFMQLQVSKCTHL